MTQDDPTTPSTPEVRAAARAAAKAARIEAARLAEQQRETAISDAVQALLDYRAEVEGAKLSTAILSAARAAAVDAPTAISRGLLLAAAVCTDDAAVALFSRHDWCRQNGAFLKTGSDLEVGSYACGVQGKPRRTIPCYALAILPTLRGRRLVLEARTAAGKAGEEAASAFAEIWREVEARTTAAEQAELGGAR